MQEMLDALDDLRPFVSRNEYYTEVKLNQSSLDDLEEVAEQYDFVYVDEQYRDEFDIPPSVTVEITIDLDQWLDEVSDDA